MISAARAGRGRAAAAHAVAEATPPTEVERKSRRVRGMFMGTPESMPKPGVRVTPLSPTRDQGTLIRSSTSAASRCSGRARINRSSSARANPGSVREYADATSTAWA